MNNKIIIKNLSFSPSDEELKDMTKKVKVFVNILKKNIPTSQVFLGGSFAKNTLVKKKIYDVDIFVRLEKDKFNLKKLEMAVNKTANSLKYLVTKIHGSREYYRVHVDGKTVFEVVPALKITRPQQAENVIDLSYFHVAYVNNKIKMNNKLAREIQLAKTFLNSAGIYGAESYIRGFSGYAVECLIIKYGSLVNMLKAIVKSEGKLILDPQRQYKNPKEIIYQINESKVSGPIVLVDPTWKERNVTAAVSQEAFDTLKQTAKKFLKSPNKSFFEEKIFSAEEFKKSVNNNKEYHCLVLKTEKQEGDIAGTKLKKYSNYLIKELTNQFQVKNSYFEYEGTKEAKIHLILTLRNEIERKGPPISMEKSVKLFKKEHKNTFIKDKIMYAKIKVTDSCKETLELFLKKQDKVAKQMSIDKIGIN